MLRTSVRTTKGMTLVEVIISVALLGIISVAFLSAFSTYYRWVIDTKRDVTEEAFSAQGDIEEAIKEIKVALATSPAPVPLPYDGIKSDITLFSTIFTEPYKDTNPSSPRERTTAYQRIVKASSPHEMISWVGKTRLPESPVPVLDILRMVLVRNGTAATDPIDNYEYYNLSNLTLEAENSLTENPENSFYRVKHEWYVSNPGYMIPIVSADVDQDYDMGRIYPRFPQEYEAIPVRADPVVNLTSSLSDTLDNSFVNAHPGRHFVYVSTPYSKAYKKGAYQVSNPVYISGPTRTDGLALHLDASLINKGDVDPTSGAVESKTGVGLTVKRWDNTFPSTAVANPYDAVAAAASERPILVHTEVGGVPRPEVSFQEDLSSYWGRALGNRPLGSVSKMSISNLTTAVDSLSASSERFDMLMVMRRVNTPSAPDPAGDPIIKSGNGTDPAGRGWALSWGDTDKLTLEAATSTTACAVNFSLGENVWYLLSITAESDSDPATTSGKLYYDLYNMKSGETANGHIADDSEMGDFSLIDSTGMDISLNGIELSEVLLYQDASASDLDDVKEYLIKKYGAELPSYTILLDSNGGEQGTQSITQKFGTRIPKPADPTRAGFTFMGWLPEVPDTMPAGGLTCVAQWAQNYTLSFDSNGGTPVSDFVAPAGTTVSVRNPTKSGYVFDGWDPTLPTSMPAEDRTFTAKWDEDIFRITFDTNGGTAVIPEYIEQSFDSDIIIFPTEPTREGYTFSGWSPTIPAKMPAGDLTIIAQWTPIDYTMIFESMPGVEHATITLPFDSSISLPEEPLRAGFVFEGWNPEVPLKMPLNGGTYLAQWRTEIRPVAQSVTTVANGNVASVTFGPSNGRVTVAARVAGTGMNGWKVVYDGTSRSGPAVSINNTNRVIFVELRYRGWFWEDGYDYSNNAASNIAALIEAADTANLFDVSYVGSGRFLGPFSDAVLTGGTQTQLRINWSTPVDGGSNVGHFRLHGISSSSVSTSGSATNVYFNNVTTLPIAGSVFSISADSVTADVGNLVSSWTRSGTGSWTSP
jgi:uncharacterized repeat protein (TIGR02543 family)/prepilin-type N-terminal cleavage/methylation domain-containing protein